MDIKDFEDILGLEEIISNKDIEKLKILIKKYNLTVKDKKLLPKTDKDKEKFKEYSEYFDFRQYATKILLNSVYGSLLNQHMKFADNRIGQSVTMTGRCITKHMNAKINEILTDDYNHKGEAILYGDTDSVTEDTLVKTNIGVMSIKTLFEICENKKFVRNKEYAFSKTLKVLSFNPETFSVYKTNFDYIYRHKTRKSIYNVILENNKNIKVTSDHNLLILDEDRKLTKASPTEKNLLGKEVIVIDSMFSIQMLKIKKIEKLGKIENEVYDIGVNKNTPWFFGNDILVHNSSYFSAYHLEEFQDINWTKENAIKLYDEIAKLVNESFGDFLKKSFNVKEEFMAIRAGRELVASKGYFITKKRYALLYFDKEGIRVDDNGKNGKIKAMGLEIKRSDTPKFVQDFLENILYDILSNVEKEKIFEKIKKFKEDFRKLDDWKKGYPKKVNKLQYYTEIHENSKNPELIKEQEIKYKKAKTKEEKARIKKYMDQLKSPRIPGHVMASINWNKMKKYYKDFSSPDITDGSKILVFTLKKNVHKINSIAIPVDLEKLPEWLNDFQVDTEEMENSLVNKKIKNLFAALEDWNVDPVLDNTEFNEIFEF